ncbi:hypothetical protein UPYG_G00031820 [Umbra pygmaea]|uniref:Coiled-coil domain-containing protein 17 n=1 Tax=Umbra pygmaea TaxID=75934 RepID=A0ABD0XMZ3_UMBPY
MEQSRDFSCRECSMAFPSLELLEKHKAFFCIGSSIGDPTVLRRGQTQSKSLFPQLPHTPAHRMVQSGIPLWSLPGKTDEGDPQGSVSEKPSLRSLADEFDKLRMSTEENMAKWPPGTEDLVQLSVRQRSHRDQLREMAQQHDRQLAEIRAYHHLLEQQRDEIARNLGALFGRGSMGHLESLLLELREKEKKNEEALQQLRVHVTDLQPGVKDMNSESPNSENRKGHMFNFDLISSVDGPLSNQIRALRLAYIQSDGSDPAFLAHMHDMELEAQSLEKQSEPGTDSKRRRKRIKSTQRSEYSEILAVEQENQRLEEEIFRIQMARGKQHREDVAVGSELHHIKSEHIHHIASVQAEIESLRREIERFRQGPRDWRLSPPPPTLFPALPTMHPVAQIQAAPAFTQPRPNSSLARWHKLDPLEPVVPAPYDPAASFVVFYDLVLGVDTTLSVLRLVSSLFSGELEVGQPSPLPPTQCQSGENQPYTHSVPPGNYALLAAKQPMPRMQPSASLSLVVELQASPYSQETQSLVSWGWVQFMLFDKHNQVQSGSWRVPVRSLPIRPTISPSQLNSTPQVGNMELCLRLVDARDEAMQSIAKINLSHYKYPSMSIQVSDLHKRQEDTPVPMSTLRSPTVNHYVSVHPYTDHEEPPPMEETNLR